MDAIRRGSRDVLRFRRALFQRLIARRIVNHQLIAAAAAEDKLRAVVQQQRVQRGDVRAHRASRNRQPLRQLLLRQRFVLQQSKQLR